MNRLGLLLCLALAACGCGTSSGLQVANSGQTTPVTAPPAAQPHVGRLDAIAFADADHGWAAGKGAIIATSDGGASWTGQYRGARRHPRAGVQRPRAWLGGGERVAASHHRRRRRLVAGGRAGRGWC